MKYEIVNTDTTKNQDIVRLASGKEVKIPRVEIQKNMAVLGITRHEAVQMYLEDEGYLENAEVEELTKKAKVNKTTKVNARENVENKKTTRERKANPIKETIIEILEKALKTDDFMEFNGFDKITAVKVENIAKIITFKVGNREFKLDLVEKRQKKQ